MGLSWLRARRHAPAPASSRPPVILGDGAVLHDDGMRSGGPAFAGLQFRAGIPAAVIRLGGGREIDVTRVLWLDALSAAIAGARDALMMPGDSPPDLPGERM
jgi:hypothetical protein